jgi:predicted small secreted protein
MSKIALVLAVSSLAMALAACETMAERVGNKEDILAAAGFTVLPANTLARQAELRKLPANKFVRKADGDKTEYVYADPVVCDCLYIGDQKAYGAYRQDLLSKRIADEEQMAALTYQDSWDWGGWDWGPWGAGWWW